MPAISCGQAWANGAPWAGRVFTVAGDGTRGHLMLGGLATAAHIAPYAVSYDDAGGFYVTAGHYRVLRVSQEGLVSLVAGNGTAGFSGDGGPAVDAGMEPTEISSTSAGGLLVADGFFNDRIREVRPDGVIVTVAGGGPIPRFQQRDGMSATQAQLNGPLGVAAEPDGGFLIAETFGSRILQVRHDGTLKIVAGGGPLRRRARLATHAILDHPQDSQPLPGGGFLIADTDANVVRRVLPNGAIRTVAGNGRACYRTEPSCKLAPVSDRRMPADTEQLNRPFQAVPYGRGSFLVADSGNGRVVAVSRSGSATTIAGCGKDGFTPDGSLATKTCFEGIASIAPLPDGGLLLATGSRVRYVAPAHPELFAVALIQSTRQQTGKRLRVRYLSTKEARYRLTFLRRGKPVLAVDGIIHAGTAVLTVPRHLGPGRYTVRLTARTPAGQNTQQETAMTVQSTHSPDGRG